MIFDLPKDVFGNKYGMHVKCKIGKDGAFTADFGKDGTRLTRWTRLHLEDVAFLVYYYVKQKVFYAR